MNSKTIVCLWILVGFIPLACVFVGGWLFWLATDRPAVFMVEPGMAVAQALLVASPFAVLALMAPARLRTEAAGVTTGLLVTAASGGVVTAGLWALSYYDAYVYWAQDQRTGANIGLGLLLLVSPLLVGGVMGVAYRLSRSAMGSLD